MTTLEQSKPADEARDFVPRSGSVSSCNDLLACSPWTPLLALDRLNSWLRSDLAPNRYWCPLRSAFKSTIYWVKTKAILETSKRWHIGMRRVMVRKPCRTCDGKGNWVPDRWGGWEEETWEEYAANYGEPCRKCEATGTVTLKFIETTIGPLRWHTPSEKWWSSSLDVYVPFPSFHHEARAHTAYQYYELAEGWEPNQPGRPMTNAEAERDMLLILREWPHEVCFALDYQHHTGFEKQWNCPDWRAAERWIREWFVQANS